MRTLDIAQLYLRVIVGGMLILHNIDKMQNYNVIISNYPDLDGIAGNFWFVLFASAECISAIMLIIGWHVRLASTILIAQTILTLLIYFPSPSTTNLELNAIYTFIYIYILISGGGAYSLDGIRNSRVTTI
ncbi:MAG: DoxX family protein [Rikenellaceae bacterium]